MTIKEDYQKIFNTFHDALNIRKSMIKQDKEDKINGLIDNSLRDIDHLFKGIKNHHDLQELLEVLDIKLNEKQLALAISNYDRIALFLRNYLIQQLETSTIIVKDYKIIDLEDEPKVDQQPESFIPMEKPKDEELSQGG